MEDACHERIATITEKNYNSLGLGNNRGNTHFLFPDINSLLLFFSICINYDHNQIKDLSCHEVLVEREKTILHASKFSPKSWYKKQVISQEKNKTKTIASWQELWL